MLVYITQHCYNLGQKDKFTIVGRFSIHTCPNFPSTPQTTLDSCIQNFSPVLILRNKLGEGEPQQFLKRMHCFMRGTEKLQKIMNNALLSQGLVSRIVKQHAGVASPSLLEIRFSQNITCNLMAISGRRFSPPKK